MERVIAGSETTRTYCRSKTSDRGRRVGLLESTATSLWHDGRAALLSCIRRPMCSTNCPRVNKRKPRPPCTRSGWLRVGWRRSRTFDHFLVTYEAKYAKATECLAKDRDTLLTFYDFPAEHWTHIRTTNPIESTFATVRLRTAKTRGCVSRAGILAMVFKLTKSAEQRWRKLKGAARLGQLIDRVRFKNGLQQEAHRIAA